MQEPISDHILLSGRESGLTSPSLISHAGVNKLKKVEKRVRLIRPMGRTRVRTRAGAVGEKASMDMTASVRIYESSAVHCILIVARREGMGSWDLLAGAASGVDVVVVARSQSGSGASGWNWGASAVCRGGGLRPATALSEWMKWCSQYGGAKEAAGKVCSLCIYINGDMHGTRMCPKGTSLSMDECRCRHSTRVCWPLTQCERDCTVLSDTSASLYITLPSSTCT